MNRHRYPRTPHLPWSPGKTIDDEVLNTVHCFDGKEVIITEKLDGECTSIYPDGYVHARSPDSKHHPSRSWIKAYAQTFAWQMPRTMRLCAENLTAWHSIFYTDLPTFIFGIGIYDGDRCLDWDSTASLCKQWGVPTVPLLWRGVWDEAKVRAVWTGRGSFPTFEAKKDKDQPNFPEDFVACEAEGYVIRCVNTFDHKDFAHNCAKFVRPHHVKTDSHWLERFVENKLR